MLTRKLDEAREAYRRKDAEASRRAHGSAAGQEPAATPGIFARESHTTGQGRFLKSII